MCMWVIHAPARLFTGLGTIFGNTQQKYWTTFRPLYKIPPSVHLTVRHKNSRKFHAAFTGTPFIAARNRWENELIKLSWKPRPIRIKADQFGRSSLALTSPASRWPSPWACTCLGLWGKSVHPLLLHLTHWRWCLFFCPPYPVYSRAGCSASVIASSFEGMTTSRCGQQCYSAYYSV